MAVKPKIIQGGVSFGEDTLAYYDEGTFTATLTGCTTTPTATLTYVRVGNMVTIRVPSTYLTGTSNSTSTTVTGMPTNIRPTDEVQLIVRGQDNSIGIAAMITISSGGLISIFKDANLGSMTGSGTKGLMACTITYPLI